MQETHRCGLDDIFSVSWHCFVVLRKALNMLGCCVSLCSSQAEIVVRLILQFPALKCRLEDREGG